MNIKDDLKSQADKKPVDIKWLIGFSLLIWLICILVPFIFSLAMNINFKATIDSTDAKEFQLSDGGIDLQLTDPNLESGLDGALSESFRKTVSTVYKATLVPSRLEENKGPFIAIGFLHGPSLVTGAPLVFDAFPEGGSKLESSATISLSNFATPAVFFLVYILFLLLIYWVLGNPNSSLRFIVVLSIVWLVWSLFTWALGGLTMRPVDEVLNQMLTEEQGTARFSLGAANIIAAPLRVFLIGTLCWVGSFLIHRARTQSSKTA